jgi:uncharacterized protein (TIGR02453 family)
MPRSAKPAPATALTYFRPEALTFLRNLAKHNDRAWFQPRKAQFEAELKEPMLAIVRKITDAMADFAPNHVRPAEKSLFRIYRDTRFSSDKRPYKTHVAAWWTHTGFEKTSGAGYYFHVSAKEVIIAAGSYMPEKEQLAAKATRSRARPKAFHLTIRGWISSAAASGGWPRNCPRRQLSKRTLPTW